MLPVRDKVEKFLKSTVRLPSTKWPFRPSPAEIAKYLPRCTDDLYAWQRSARPADDTFVLHDGPPYANGDLHVGHALNKIIKDVICRTKLAEGKRVDFIPGWDCHGLPIEQKVLKEKGWKQEDGYNALQIRTAARKFAFDAVRKQMKGFRSWAIMSDWERHWKTMDKDFELRQLAVFKAMVQAGLIFRKHKPVHWSPSSRTALAEAEIEYNDDHVSTTALIKFPIVDLQIGSEPVYAVIWTTTPWTIPANQAIAVNQDFDYSIVKSLNHGQLLIASSRLDYLRTKLGEDVSVITIVSGKELIHKTYSNLSLFGEDGQNRPIYHADFVKEDSGTGLVHCAPGHGKDDYEALQTLIKAGRVQVKAPVDDQGRYTPAALPADPSVLTGLDVFTEGSMKILDLLRDEGRLLTTWKFRHSYPIDWRTKLPVMTRATAQWFADVSTIKEATLSALDNVTFKPAAGKNRLRSFVENRSEWCISRQRAWGVPIPALYHIETGEALLTPSSIDHIVSVIRERGINAWWSDAPDEGAWVPGGHDIADYRRGIDTMDVWFDSGTSWTFMKGEGNVVPTADIYLEGSDQHRGWFQSSLLTQVAYQSSLSANVPAHAPFRTLITHGFTLDGNGRKMSKSEGNTIDPDQIINSLGSPSAAGRAGTSSSSKKKPEPFSAGPDSLRLWAASSDWTKDVVISERVITTVHTNLKTYRNTFKLLLGLLRDFDPQHMVQYEDLFQLDQIALLHLHRTSETVRGFFSEYEFHKALSSINKYITSDLSGFYIEAIKDTLYCDSVSSSRRQSALTTIYHIFRQFQHMLGPITPLLVEETYAFSPENVRQVGGNPHQQVWAPLPCEWNAEKYVDVLSDINAIKASVNLASERARAEHGMGKSLASEVVLYIDPGHPVQAISDETWQELLVVSRFSRASSDNVPSQDVDRWLVRQSVEGIRNGHSFVTIEPARGGDCARCWKQIIPPQQMNEFQSTGHVPLCSRCDDVVAEYQTEGQPKTQAGT